VSHAERDDVVMSVTVSMLDEGRLAHVSMEDICNVWERFQRINEGPSGEAVVIDLKEQPWHTAMPVSQTPENGGDASRKLRAHRCGQDLSCCRFIFG
jgi:hypothetical protein